MNLFQNMSSAFPVYQQQQTAQQQAMLKLQQEQQAIAYQKMQMDELQRQQAAAAQWQEQLRASQAQQMGTAQQTPSPGRASQPMQQAQPYQAMPTQPAYPQPAQQVQIPPPPRAQQVPQVAAQPAEPQRPQPVPDYNTARAGFMQKTYPAYQQAVLSQDPTAQKYAQNAEKDFEHYYASLEKQYGQQEATYRDFQKEQAEARKEKAPKGSDHELLVAAGFVPGTPAYQAEAKKLLAKRDRMPGGQGGAKAPSGYEWDPEKPDALRPIPGGPRDTSGRTVGETMAQRQPTMYASVQMDIGELKLAIDQMEKLKSTAGPFFGSKSTGVTRALEGVLTTEKQQDFERVANRVSVALSSLQSMGRGLISDSKVAEARKLVPLMTDKGTNPQKKLDTLRRLVEISEEALNSKPGSGQSAPSPAQAAPSAWTSKDEARLKELEAKHGAK